MTAQLAPQPVFQAFAPNGGFLVGGQLFTYAAGTSTPQATYIDSTQTTQNTNPVILNAMGEANVWLSPLLAYKFVLQDSAGNPVWSVDNITGGPLTIIGNTAPTNTAMGNGPPSVLGAQLGTVAVPSTNAQPMVSFANYVAATTGFGAGYVGGAGWFSTYAESGSLPNTGIAGVTGFVQIDGSSGINAVGVHGFSIVSAGISGLGWAGWFTAHDNNTTINSQCMGVEIDLVLNVTRPHVTANLGSNGAVGLWVNNQSDAVGSFHGTAAIGITAEFNGGTSAFSQWQTGLLITAQAIVPGAAGHPTEAIQINGGSLSANKYSGIRLLSQFDVGLDLSGGTYTGTAAAILLGNLHVIYAIDAGATGQPVAYMNGVSKWVLGQGSAGTILTGTTSNDSAAAGLVGEQIRSAIASGSAIALTTSTPINVTSISLTAGDWDVDGFVGFVPGATTNYTAVQGTASTSSATIGSGFGFTVPTQGIVSGATLIEHALVTNRFNLNATTTIFLCANAAFTVSTMAAYGAVRARRVR